MRSRPRAGVEVWRHFETLIASVAAALQAEAVDFIPRRKGAAVDWVWVEIWTAEFAVIPGRERLPETVRELRARAGSG